MMKILFTGASSFTGYWFVKELAQAGHDVTAIFRLPLDHYQGIRRKRVEKLMSLCRPVFSCSFGSEVFFDTIHHSSHWDVLCHHASDVADYKSPDFNYLNAAAQNTHRLKETLDHLKQKKCNRLVLTGSVFEQDEGKGSDDLRAVSPYGLSKGLTSDIFRYYCSLSGFFLSKFVIPNPFGPFEELRFTSFLVQQWLAGKTAIVNSPDYIRDNIHVSLLSKVYHFFVETSPQKPFEKINPSGYQESQGQFTARFSKEMEHRLSLPCRYELKKQIQFSEPHIRVNSVTCKPEDFFWNEKHAWDELAYYYQTQKGLL